MVSSFRKDKKSSNIKFIDKNKYIFLFIFIFLQLFIVYGSINYGAKLYKNGQFTFWKNDLSNKFKKMKNNFLSYFSADLEKYYLQLNFIENRKLENSQLEAIKKNVGEFGEVEYSKGIITNEDKSLKYPLRIRLKGTTEIHFLDPLNWSFKVKTKNITPLFNNKEFSLQAPRARSGINEYIFQELLKQENLFSHRMKLVNLFFNNQSLGNYFLIDGYTKYFIEANKRRESVILAYDKKPIVKSSIYNPNWEETYLPKAFNIAPLEAAGGTKPSTLPGLKNQGFELLSLFQRGDKYISEISHYKDFAKILAIRALMGSKELDWRDMKFYINPITSKLELISREIHTSKNDINPGSWWMLDPNKTQEDYKQLTKLLQKDELFIKEYIKYLYKFSDYEFINNFLKKNEVKFNNLEKKLYYFSNNEKEKIDYKSRLLNNALYIRRNLQPSHKINVHKSFIDNENLKLIVSNVGNFPLEVNCINYQNKIVFCPKVQDKILWPMNGKNQSLTFIPQKIKNLNSKNKSDKNLITNKFNYKILGTKFLFNEQLFFTDKFFSNSSNNLLLPLNIKDMKDEFLNINHKTKKVTLLGEKIFIKNSILVPKEYTLEITSKNREIYFDNDSYLLIEGKIIAKGEKNSRIRFTSAQTSTGAIIINSIDKESNFNYVSFDNLGSPKLLTEKFTGALTIYESNILISNSEFINNKRGDDYLNAIRSNVNFKNLSFKNVISDGIDLDFCNGYIDTIYFDNINNDALDFSGSNIQVKNIFANNIGDKGISVGEKSNINLENIQIQNSSIAIASKDSSKVKIKKPTLKLNKVDYAAYNKKPEFKGGKIFISDYKNKSNLLLKDQKSKIVYE